MPSLRWCLERAPRRLLLAIARARGITGLWEVSKSELVDELERRLVDSVAIDELMTSLSSAEQAVLQDLMLADGRMPMHAVTRQYGEIRAFRPWREDEPGRPWDNPASPRRTPELPRARLHRCRAQGPGHSCRNQSPPSQTGGAIHSPRFRPSR